jgi:two-component sensor histidine kinase
MLNQRIDNPVLRLRSGRDVDLTRLLPAAAAIHYFEDESGRLWLSRDDGKIYRADATRPGPLIVESFAVDFPLTIGQAMMVGDGQGGLWLGNKDNEMKMGRLREGRFIPVEVGAGLPETDPRAFHLDSRGWLWIGLRNQGVSMTREPGAERPQFISYRAAEGALSSNAVWVIAEDSRGRIYFGTNKGVDRFDPQSGAWRHYTRRDGLAGDRVFDLHRDRDGRIWVATIRGLSIIDPGADVEESRPLAIYITRVNIAGEDMTLPETGAAMIPAIGLASGRNNLSIEYVAPSYRGGEGLRYQYRLEGADDDWSVPTRERAVNYAKLAPGAYRFLVRALNDDGKPSPSAATFGFRILPPLYLRWWFLALAAGTIGAIVYLFYRYRLGRLLELERVRTRIAADLHDDISSNLTRIAILSEVANSRSEDSMNGEAGGMGAPLASIARLSRESVASMSDIVWAINPKKDSLLDLVRRMRRLLEEALPPQGIEYDFRAPEIAAVTRLGAGLRRDFFLIFKEAINIAVRHARCQRIEVDLHLDHGYLVLRVSDDGTGFDAGEQGEGQGLVNMRRRAEALGGEFELTSGPGKGTIISLRVLRRHSG